MSRPKTIHIPSAIYNTSLSARNGGVGAVVSGVGAVVSGVGAVVSGVGAVVSGRVLLARVFGIANTLGKSKKV